jgi:hypothetical protein
MKFEDIIARVSWRAMTGGRDPEMDSDDDRTEQAFFAKRHKCQTAEAIAMMPDHPTITLTGRAGPSITVAATADTHQNPEGKYIHCPVTGEVVSAPVSPSPTRASSLRTSCTARPITAALAFFLLS